MDFMVVLDVSLELFPSFDGSAINPVTFQGKDRW